MNCSDTMNMLKKIMKDYLISEGIIASVLKDFQKNYNVVVDIKGLGKLQDKAEQLHKQTLKEYENKKAAIQNSCGHGMTKYYPDASGNNDSETVCLLCEKVL